MSHSKATLHITVDGLTRAVAVDGHKIDNVAEASTEHLPDKISILTIKIYVNEIETVRVDRNWWPPR